MNYSMSDAQNGGEDHFFLSQGADQPFRQVSDALPEKVSKGWELSAAANDLDGDGLPELYLGNDFGPDRLLHNRSTPGRLNFALVQDTRSPVRPKSKQMGLDSFKGMGIDFGDLNSDGLYDMFVSNITTSWGIEESNFHYLTAAKDQADLSTKLKDGNAPFDEESGSLGTAWSGWGWDVKIADFNNSGEPAIAQANGFVKGEVNRWPQLQELATANDMLLDNPYWWPNVTKGDDLAGNQRMHFFVKKDDGTYVNLAGELGIDVPVPTRGIATGDVEGDGKLDFAIARQWDQPAFYCNETKDPGSFLGLRLTHDTPATAGALPAPGSAVVGAQATVTTADGRKHIARVDGGGGHSGKRSNEIHIGLGEDVTGPMEVRLEWRDRGGELREQSLQLSPGWHDLRLGSQAKEK
jgi:enediyne biosynthesis protein E4